MEVVPSLRRSVRAAPRAGVVVLMRPELEYYIRHVTNETEEQINGVIQGTTVEI